MFSKGFEMFENSDYIDKVFISDSIPKVNKMNSEKLKIISLESMISKIIELDFHSKSISELYTLKK